MTEVKDRSPAILAANEEGERSSKLTEHRSHTSIAIPAEAPMFSQPDEIIGDSAQIRFIKQYTDRAAGSEATVLITGETGTGKELFARRVHRMSNRRDHPLVSINCAAIPDTLLESELFGFERGAFTGAVSRQEGRLVQANGGTLFLDEIGDLSLSAQAKLLRVVEQKEVRPLGSPTPRMIDVRLVAATNRNLEELAAQDKFRQDLFFRLSVIPVHVPPLRERVEDIPLIAAHFLRTFSFQHRRPFVSLTAGAQRYLKEQPWAGNARELRNVIERVFLFSNDESITEQEVAQMCHLTDSWRVGRVLQTTASFRTSSKSQPELRKSHTGYRRHNIAVSQSSEMEQVRKALEETKWNKSRAAKLLHCSRMTIYRKVVEYELCPSASASPEKAWATPLSD
jgi:two-component system, NtrC family, response regulator HydG